MGVLRLPSGATYDDAAVAKAKVERIEKARKYRKIAGNTNDAEVAGYYLAKARELEAQL